MCEYDFILKFRLPEASADPGQFVGALAAAGCDDATVGIGRHGRIALSFTREAGAPVDAVCSAVRDVTRSIPGATLIDVMDIFSHAQPAS